MKPTPRTDAFRRTIGDMNDPAYIDHALIHARNLERQLSDALDAQDLLRKQFIVEVRNGERLAKALSAMLTHMGMDEDEWNKVTFTQARTALRLHESGDEPTTTDCPIHGRHEGDCSRC